MLTDSKPSLLIAGLLLGLCVFVGFWFVFSIALAFGMMYVGWFDIFRPQFYQDVVAFGGGAILAMLPTRMLARWIASHREVIPSDESEHRFDID